MKDTNITVTDYGDMLAKVNGLELISFEQDGGYQGEYLAIMKDEDRLYYYIGSYGSCSGCDWLEDKGDYNYGEGPGGYTINYTEALEYCGDIKPKYIVPLSKPLEFKSLGEYNGWELL